MKTTPHNPYATPSYSEVVLDSHRRFIDTNGFFWRTWFGTAFGGAFFCFLMMISASFADAIAGAFFGFLIAVHVAIITAVVPMGLVRYFAGPEIARAHALPIAGFLGGGTAVFCCASMPFFGLLIATACGALPPLIWVIRMPTLCDSSKH